jgi:hypothetical protein
MKNRVFNMLPWISAVFHLCMPSIANITLFRTSAHCITHIVSWCPHTRACLYGVLKH